MNDERWLSVDEIAVHLGISKETIYRWLEKGKIPAHRVGKLWKFRTSEIDEWVIHGCASAGYGKKGRLQNLEQNGN